MSPSDGTFEHGWAHGNVDYYELSPSSSVDALKPLPEAFLTENVKKCPICRGPLRDINQYNRILYQGLIEEAAKKIYFLGQSTVSPT